MGDRKNVEAYTAYMLKNFYKATGPPRRADARRAKYEDCSRKIIDQ